MVILLIVVSSKIHGLNSRIDELSGTTVSQRDLISKQQEQIDTLIQKLSLDAETDSKDLNLQM